MEWRERFKVGGEGGGSRSAPSQRAEGGKSPLARVCVCARGCACIMLCVFRDAKLRLLSEAEESNGPRGARTRFLFDSHALCAPHCRFAAPPLPRRPGKLATTPVRTARLQCALPSRGLPRPMLGFADDDGAGGRGLVRKMSSSSLHENEAPRSKPKADGSLSPALLLRSPGSRSSAQVGAEEGPPPVLVRAGRLRSRPSKSLTRRRPSQPLLPLPECAFPAAGRNGGKK